MKLTIADWEFARAEYFASLTRQIVVEGTDGYDLNEPKLDVAAYDGEDPVATAARVRAGAYAMLRALERGPAWEVVTLGSGWSSYLSAGTPQYRRDPFGYLEMRGGVFGGTVGTPITTLPGPVLPKQPALFVVPAFGGAGTGQLQIDPSTGALTLTALGTGASTAFISLAGVRWHIS